MADITIGTSQGNDLRQAITDQGVNPLFNLTAAQIDTWVVNNVTDLATAKTALRQAGKLLGYLLAQNRLQAQQLDNLASRVSNLENRLNL